MTALQFTEDAAQCMTSHILDRYVSYLRAHVSAAESAELAPDGTPLQTNPATSLEDALAPLEIIYGKTFLSAVAIALHGAEPVIRYVEAPERTREGEGASTDVPTASAQVAPPRSNACTTRSFYRVGEYVLYSPFYCPCSAYAFQSVRRQEVWCCKHMLALQIALRIESSGIPQDNLRERVVGAATFQSMLLDTLSP